MWIHLGGEFRQCFTPVSWCPVAVGGDDSDQHSSVFCGFGSYVSFGYACWIMDFVCCNLWFACCLSMVGSMAVVWACRDEKEERRRKNSRGLPSVGSLKWSLRFFLFWVSNCRIGEAAVPGPTLPFWSIGVCNPSGLMNKGHLLDSKVDCWMVCETHLSQSSYHRFLSGLRAEGSNFKWCVPGAHVPCRSTISSIGAWSGVAVVSQWPARALPVDWPDAVHASSRLVCSTAFIHDVWVSGVTVYGTPTGPTHPNAKATTNRLLQHATFRIAQSHGPRFVAGDWNHDLDGLDAVDSLLALGFRDVQDLHFSVTGVFPKPTCKLKTRRDFLFISPELQQLFVSCEVDHCAWPDHSAVIALFRGGGSDLTQFPWPIPKAIPWNKLRGRQDGTFVDFSGDADCNVSYQQLWQNVESCASVFAASKGRPLHGSCFGRGQRYAPVVVKSRPPPVPLGRKGVCQPAYFGSSWTQCQNVSPSSQIAIVCASCPLGL